MATSSARRKTPDMDVLFPLAAVYRNMGKPTGMLLRETGGDSPFQYTERHLQCVWFDDSLRPARLRTATGEDVTVDFPGRWNLEAGPDFIDAVVTLGPDRRKVRGDIEVHVRPGDWKAHSHGADPAYSRVMLHLTYFDGTLPAGALPKGAMELSLRQPLGCLPGFSFESIDITAYPYAVRPVSPPPCAVKLTSWDRRDVEHMLDCAGEERLRLKALRLEAAIRERGEEQAFYEETLSSLGYKHNRAAFRRLAQAVPLNDLRAEANGDPVAGYAVLLGVAGLLPSQISQKWDEKTRAFFRLLWDAWWKRRARWDSMVLPKGTWRLAGLRPPNHPIRRLAAAAALFCNDSSPLSLLKKQKPGSPGAWFASASNLFQQADMDYWSARASFGGREGATTALIGSDRTAAIISNVVIPFLGATGVKVTGLLQAQPAAEENDLLRQTAFCLFGRDHNPALYKTGLRQQGLLQIFHDFCVNNRSACRDCALANALESRRKT